MLYLVLLLSESTDPTIWPQLCLDTSSCNADHMIVWLLHHMWCLNKDYTIMPLALQPNAEVPWDICMEEFPKLWQNSTYISWKTGCPGEEVSITLTLISTNHLDEWQSAVILTETTGDGFFIPGQFTYGVT